MFWELGGNWRTARKPPHTCHPTFHTAYLYNSKKKKKPFRVLERNLFFFLPWTHIRTQQKAKYTCLYFLKGPFAFASIITDICWPVQKFSSVSIVSGSNNPETLLTSTFLNSYLNPWCFTCFSLTQSGLNTQHMLICRQAHARFFTQKTVISDHILIPTGQRIFLSGQMVVRSFSVRVRNRESAIVGPP